MCLMIDGKQRRGWYSIQGAQSRRGVGKGYREGGEAAHRGGGYRGRQEREWKEGRQARRAKKFGVSEWYGCSSSRVRIYIAAIYSIFIYIYYLYIYNINIISIYLIIYINIIPFSPFFE